MERGEEEEEEEEAAAGEGEIGGNSCQIRCGLREY